MPDMASKEKGRMLKVSDYHVFPVSLPPQPALPDLEATHYMYIRPHQPKIPDAATPRSLFVSNVPFDSSPLHMKHLFSSQIGLPAGRIAEVEFFDLDEPDYEEQPIVPTIPTNMSGRKRKRHEDIIADLPSLDIDFPPVWDRKLHHPGTNAVLVFVDRASMEAAYKAARASAKSGARIVWGEGVEDQLPPLGLERYRRHAELLHPDVESLTQLADQYLGAYDAHINARERILTEQRQLPDEDGFITVTRTSAKGGVRGVKQDAAKERLNKQMQKREEFTDFYRFQQREKAKQRSKELVTKFQEDVEKAKRLKERRGRMHID